MINRFDCTAAPGGVLRDPASGQNGHPVQIVTDDPEWWDALARNQPDASWFRWALVPTAFDRSSAITPMP